MLGGGLPDAGYQYEVQTVDSRTGLEKCIMADTPAMQSAVHGS
jgi:hypothetical protein